MEWRIKWLDIENFKSIKKARFDCKRVNIFVGPPNVGKSNLLEAVGMLGAYNGINKDKLFSEFVRYEKFRNLFYDNDRSLHILIDSNFGHFFSKFHQNNIESYDIFFGYEHLFLENLKKQRDQYSINDIVNEFMGYMKHSANLSEPNLLRLYSTVDDYGRLAELNTYSKANVFHGAVKKYEFNKGIDLTERYSAFLKPPYGENVFLLLEANTNLYNEASEIFEQYGLKLYFDNETNRLEIVKTVGNRLYKIPYSLCADTLQRYIFHLLAIKTNKNSVLIFEEPEAHSYPKYISEIASEMVEDKSNQYFIATHSPYLLGEFIERCGKGELALFVCGYKDYQTVVRELTEEEIRQIVNEGIDLFYNMEAFSV